MHVQKLYESIKQETERIDEAVFKLYEFSEDESNIIKSIIN